MKNSFIRLLLITGGLLLIPLLAMQVTNEVVWTASDFVVMGLLLLSAGLVYVHLIKVDERKRRVAGAALLIGLALLWVHLSVGLV